MPIIETNIHVAAPPSAVWRVLTDFDAFRHWNPMMVSMSGKPELGAPLRLRFVLRIGGRSYGTSAKVLVCEPEKELRWGGGVPGLLRVEHWVRLIPADGGTRVEHCESFRGLFGGAVRLVGLTPAPYEAMNAALKQKVESDARG